MLDWIIVISLLILGLVLLWTELVILPGTIITGVLGLICSVLSIYFSYEFFDTWVGHTIFSIHIIATIIALFYSLKSKTWQRFALNNTFDSRVNEHKRIFLRLGDEGKAVSSLRPLGRADFDGEYYEVSSVDEYLSRGTDVVVVRIDGHRIFVKKI